jgi:hypothetical protein
MRPFVSFLAALAACFSYQSAAAASINYGSHSGTSVTYIDVTEEALTAGDAEPLFGAPVFSGDSFDFNPVGFDAHASGAGGNDPTGARLTFSVQAAAGFAITNIQFGEAGDVTLSGAGTDGTSAVVTAAGTITITSVDGAAIAPIVQPISLSFTPSGGTYGLVSDGGGLPIYHTQWTGSLAVNVSQILTAEAVPFALGATDVSIDIVNTLTATSEAGTQSLIAKKDFGAVAITVPEPGTGLLAGLAIAGLAVSRRFRGTNIFRRTDQPAHTSMEERANDSINC